MSSHVQMPRAVVSRTAQCYMHSAGSEMLDMGFDKNIILLFRKL